MFRQYALAHGAERRVGWLDHEQRLKPGTMVTLKGETDWWVIELAGTVTLPTPPDARWQVGGIVGRMRLPERH